MIEYTSANRISVRFRNQSAGNQTEIIYSVFVDRKPVLAKTAADDMKLVTEEEVAKVMEKLVFIKAERK